MRFVTAIVLIGVRIVVIAAVALTVLRAVARCAVRRTVKRIVVALGLGEVTRLLMMIERQFVIALWLRRLCRCVATDRMQVALIDGLGGLRRRPCQHPGRRTGWGLFGDIQIVIEGFRCWRRRSRAEMRALRILFWCGRCSPSVIRIRVGLPDQARQFGQRVTFALWARLVIPIRAIVRGIGSVLISISHVVLHPLRESADPSF